MLQWAVNELVKGRDGKDVLDEMKLMYERSATRKHDEWKVTAKNAAICKVRKLIIGGGHRSSDFDPSPLRAFEEGNAEIKAFLSAPLKDQVEIQKQHKTTPTWTEREEDALRKIDLLPSNMKTFKLSTEDNIMMRRNTADGVKRKNESVLIIDQPVKLLQAAREIVKNASSNTTVAPLSLALLLLSGRRFTEILNMRSVFERTDSAYHTIFHGQLKKKGASSAPYVIPLLIPFEEWMSGLSTLREIQKRTKKKPVEQLTMQKVQERYQGFVQRAMKRGVLPFMTKGAHIHDLRATYASLVFEMFECKCTFQRTAMDILGHCEIADSLSYGHVRIENGEELRNTLGPVFLD